LARNKISLFDDVSQKVPISDTLLVKRSAEGQDTPTPAHLRHGAHLRGVSLAHTVAVEVGSVGLAPSGAWPSPRGSWWRPRGCSRGLAATTTSRHTVNHRRGQQLVSPPHGERFGEVDVVVIVKVDDVSGLGP
jgi:hypothetical protein